MPKIKGLPFRSGAIKQTKPRTMRNHEGWFEYACARCGAPVQRRKRQHHVERVACLTCTIFPPLTRP